MEFPRNNIMFVCEQLTAHSLWKSVLVKDLVSFENSALFLFSKEQAASCYACLFYSFSARRWVARELRTLKIEQFLDLVDDLRYAYFDDDGNGPIDDGMVNFLCGFPELCQKQKTLTIFRLSCLCIGHFPPVLT